jgi:ligand-binding sensor domain-containing protein/two-component sensor histidine kinase
MLRRCFTTFLFITAATFVFSQTSNQSSNPIVQPPTLHQWGAVTLFHGLPSDRVRAITQDANGVMWFGTDAGLARYDGRRMQAMTANELPQGKINALSVDENKTLWIGTDSGVVRFDDGQFKLVKETEGRIITSFLHSEKNITLATSEDGFIFEFQIQADNSVSSKTIPKNQLQSPDVDNPGALEITSVAKANGKIFVGCRGGGVLEIEGEEVKEIRSEPRAYFVEALETNGKNRFWFGAKASTKSSGLYESTNVLHPRKIGADIGTVLSLRSDRQNNLWVGTDGQGVFQFRDDVLVNQFTFDRTAGGLRSNRIFEIYVDREDVVWFGTDRGVSRYDPRALRVERLSENAESNFIRVIYRSKDGTLYCGTNRGLFFQKGNVWQSVSELEQKTIYAIDEDSNGGLLVGTASGLYMPGARAARPPMKFNEIKDGSLVTRTSRSSAGEPPALPADSIRAIAQLQNKTYIATFGRGVELLEGENRKLVFPKGNDDSKLKEINTLYADAQGRLWIGTTSKGVFIFDGTNANNLTELQNISITSIDGTQNGLIWIATAKGLYVYNKEKLALVLPNHDVRGVRANNSTIRNPQSAIRNQAWCATADGGVFKIIFDENEGTIISTLDAEQGLPSQKTFALLQEDNVWLIGTNRGIARYEINSYAPILQAVRAIGKREYASEELKNNLSLEYPQNSLVLEVAGISSRTFPEQFQYTFKLFDGKGNVIQNKTTKESQFSMQGLKSGNYRVEIVAYNSDLVASQTLTFEFTVANAPFPWFTVLLTLLLLLAAAALLWAIFEHRRITSTSAALANANQELADARLRLANEAESERRRIARDLHDQTLADLRRLMLMSDKQNESEKNINPNPFRSEIENVSNEIRRICEDLSPSVLENVGFTPALEFALADAVAHLPEEKRFEYEFICEDDLEERLNFNHGVTMQIYRIAQEAISNVCRHSNAKAVQLEVSLNDDHFIMRLSDDGNGFDVNKQSSGRGLANIAARASLIEANVEWLKNEKGGMTFVLKKEIKF